VWGKIGATGLDFEVEGASQFGKVGRGDIGAFMTTGSRLCRARPSLSPRAYVEFDYASGDRRPAGTSGPTTSSIRRRTRSGHIDYIGRPEHPESQRWTEPEAASRPDAFIAAVLLLARLRRDAIYNKSGGVLRRGTGTSARYVGAEIDLLATYNVTRHILGYAGYSHFWTGEFIRKTGPAKDSDSSTWRCSTRSERCPAARPTAVPILDQQHSP